MGRRTWLVGLLAVAALAAVPALFSLRSSEQASAVFTAPTDKNYVAVDCDIVTAGVQTSCNVFQGQSIQVGVVVGNVVGRGTPSAKQLEGLQFSLLANQTMLEPAAGADSNLNANPNFNESGVSGTWNCNTPGLPPDNDQNPDASVADSFLACQSSLNGPSIPLGGTATVAFVTYSAVGTGGSAVHPSFAVMGDENFLAWADCNPNVDTNAACIPASISVEEAPFDGLPYMRFDCDPAAGIQSNCVYPTNAGTLNVRVLIDNSSGPDVTPASFNFTFNADAANGTVLTAVSGSCTGAGLATTCNPEILIPLGGPTFDTAWSCGPPPPDNDLDDSAVNGYQMRMSCFNADDPGPIAAGAEKDLARAKFTVPGASGVVPLSMQDVNIFDNLGAEVYACDPGLACPTGSITIGDVATPTAGAATDTPQATATSTSTNTPTATNTTAATSTNTPTATNTTAATSTHTPTATNTTAPTATNTTGPTSTNTTEPTATDTAEPTATNTTGPTATNTTEPSATNTSEPTATDTAEPTATDTAVPTSTNTPTATNTSAPVATDTPTSTPTQGIPAGVWSLQFDCDVVASGIQNDCTLAGGATTAAIDAVLVNDSGAPARLAAFNFTSLGDNKPVFSPVVPSCVAPGTQCNPDFNEGIGGASWACGPPNPQPDADGDGDPSTSQSVISCFNAVDGPEIADGQSLVLGRVSYTVTGSGEGLFVPVNVNGFDDLGAELIFCSAVGAGPCAPATIRTAGQPATDTPTAEPTATNTQVTDPTATNTAEPTATNTQVGAATATNTPTHSPTSSPTATNTAQPTATNTQVSDATATNTAVATATNTAEPTETATVGATQSPQATGTVQVTRTVSVTKTVGATKTVGTTETPEVTETPATLTPTHSPTSSPTNTATATSTATTTATSTSTATTSTPTRTSTTTANTHTPTRTATKPPTTATSPASTATRQSTVAAIATRPTGSSGGASSLPDTGQGGAGGGSDLLVAVLSIAAAGVGLYGVVAMKRKRAR